MKQAFLLLCAVAVLTVACGAFSSVVAQTPSATPDPFVAQLTSSPGLFRTNAFDISANGRFVVFESNGNVATQNRNNADGNREIFIADYAQRRIFQITNTKNVPKSSASPSPTPTPSPSPSPTVSPSPTPSPVPTPADTALVQIEISNVRPMITAAPALNASNRRVFAIVFSSNAPTPGSFDGVDTGGALAADGNTEIWLYVLPEVSDVNLAAGADLPLQDLSAGTFVRLTNTPASRVPTPGAAGVAPFIADDNRDAMISDDGNIVSLISTANLVPPGNTDRNPELFLFNRATSTFVQATNTLDTSGGTNAIFTNTPSLSGDGSVVAFLSNANLSGNNADLNEEVYVANFNGASVSNVRQVTRTQFTTAPVNLLQFGRRVSRNGALIVLESRAADPKANNTTNENGHAVFVYTVASDTFNVIPIRAVSGGDSFRLPTFTDYNASLSPSTLIFTSSLNIKTDGTFPAEGAEATGLNPDNSPEIYATQLPVTSSNTYTRLTNNPPVLSLLGIRPLASETRKRIAFTLQGSELGGGNVDGSPELFYMLTPTVTAESATALTFFTGASFMPVPTVSPSPSPTPTPSPSPGDAAGLAPGELGVIRSTLELATDTIATGGSENSRSPALPIELNGVSVSIGRAAAGLYFVGGSPDQYNVVVPIGLTPATTATVAVNNNGTLVRSFIPIVAAQPDIFTSTNGPLGRAAVFNVTNPLNRTPEPFPVKSLDANGNLVATVLEVNLTGVRNVATTEISVTVGTTAIGVSDIIFVGPNREMPGFDTFQFRLPESLAGAGDVPIVITVTKSGTFTSRPAANSARITIAP